MAERKDSPFFCHSHLETVLIGSSLGEGSDPVVRTGITLARAAGARVYVVHAVPPEPAAAFELGWLEPGTLRKDAEPRGRLLRDQIERLGLYPDELAGLKVVVGTPRRVIAGTARQINADLIVVEASEPRGRLGTRLGSTADRVVRMEACSVLVVRGELPVPPRRVLMPIDLSALSADSFRCGLHFLGQISAGAPTEIEAIYALDFQDRLEFLHPDMPWTTTSRQVEQQAVRELERFVDENDEDAPVPVGVKVRIGEAREQILDELERNPADLVVLGTNGRSGFDRLLPGGVASAVLREAPCSVLMIPPEAAGCEDLLAEDVVASQTAAPGQPVPPGGFRHGAEPSSGRVGADFWTSACREHGRGRVQKHRRRGLPLESSRAPRKLRAALGARERRAQDPSRSPQPSADRGIFRRLPESGKASRKIPAPRRDCRPVPDFFARLAELPGASRKVRRSPGIFRRATEFWDGSQNFPAAPGRFQRFPEFSGAWQKIPAAPGKLQRFAEDSRSP